MITKKAWLIGSGVLVLVAALVTTVLLLTDDADPVAATCDNALSVYFADDGAMLAAAARLQDDDRTAQVITETQDQAAQRLNKLANDPPDLRVGARPIHAAAALHLAAAADVSRSQFAQELHDEIAGPKDVKPADCRPGRHTPSTDPLLFSAKVSCRQPVRVWFDRDDDMTAAAELLRADERVATVAQETKAEAYEKAKELFRDDPEMLETLTPDSLPASLEISPAPGVDHKKLAADLTQSLPGASRDGSDPLSVCFAARHPVTE